MVAQAFNACAREAEAGGSEYKACLVYTVSFRPAWDAQGDLVSEINTEAQVFRTQKGVSEEGWDRGRRRAEKVQRLAGGSALRCHTEVSERLLECLGVLQNR